MLLEELQSIDVRSDGSQARIQEALAEIDLLDQRLNEAIARIDSKKTELANLEAERISQEETLATENANKSRSETNLKGITTQKEYQAVNKEIASAKKMITELEEQLLQKISRAEELSAEISSMEEESCKLKENISGQQAEIRLRIDTEVVAVESESKTREGITKSLPASMLKRYDKLREVRKGLAIVQARDGGCLGCNMHIPPQMYNNLFRGEELITCPHCQRILVLHQESPGQ